MLRIRYSVRNMKYFTPPSTFDVLWMEFAESINHIKMLLLDFFMALSKLFKTLSHVLAALLEGLELVAYFLLSLINLIWLLMKIILLLGEQIKAMGPGGPPQNPNYYKKDYKKSDSFSNYSTSKPNIGHHMPPNELQTITKVAGLFDSKMNEATESKAISEKDGQSPSIKKELEESSPTTKDAAIKEECLQSRRKDFYSLNAKQNLFLLNPISNSISTDSGKDDKNNLGKNGSPQSGQVTLEDSKPNNEKARSSYNSRSSESFSATRSSFYYRHRSSENQRMASLGHVPGFLKNHLDNNNTLH